MASTGVTIPERTGTFPTLCGFEAVVGEATRSPGPAYLGESDVDLAHANSGFAIALHTHHQRTIANVRQRLVEQGLEAAVDRKKQEHALSLARYKEPAPRRIRKAACVQLLRRRDKDRPWRQTGDVLQASLKPLVFGGGVVGIAVDASPNVVPKKE